MLGEKRRTLLGDAGLVRLFWELVPETPDQFFHAVLLMLIYIFGFSFEDFEQWAGCGIYDLLAAIILLVPLMARMDRTLGQVHQNML